MSRASFDLAARRVAQRYRRRWPNTPAHVATPDDIKWRWYRNHVSHIKRETLGKTTLGDQNALHF